MNTSVAKSKQTDKDSGRVATLRRIVLLLLLAFLCIYLFSVVYSASDFFAQSTESNALLRLEEDLTATERQVAQHYANLQQIADKLADVKQKKEVDAILSSYAGSPIFGSLRYYVDNTAYSYDGALVESEVDSEIEIFAAERRQGALLFFDSVMEQDCVAFFLPVSSSSFVDGLLSIVPIRDRETGVELLDLDALRGEDCEALLLIGRNDRVLLYSAEKGFGAIGSDVQVFLRALTSAKEESAVVIDALHKQLRYTRSVQAQNGEQYSASCIPVEALGESAMLLNISKNEALIASEMVFIRHIVVVLIVAAAAFIAVLIYSILYHRQAKKALSTAMLTDADIECPNAEQFRRDAIDVVYTGRRPYALLYYQLRRHHHIVETLGEQQANEVFRFVAKVFESFCTPGETYGYAGEGNFLLLNYFQSEKQLGEKIRLLEAVINKSELLKSLAISIKFNVGVYLTSQGRRTVPQMIECAALAAQSAKAGASLPYILYTEQVNEEIAKNERIEAQMEEALASGEFKLFLQPKYNVRYDRIDSAEALVRWFDPSKGEYRFPAAFIGLFESNGFIVKLDHFIYLEVLKYMSHAAERGEKIVPISVNVSRVTAIDDEFLDFYIGNKKKYQIGDQFITLELTESFAMENYEKLADIVRQLHENGIRCSIDDFGLGYSSFNTIKQIPIDELKLDRLFLSDGLDRERDDKIIRTIVQLAKDIRVDIVQEGVENEEMFNRVVSMGCEIIQGYYYAKAISLEEYRIFLNSNTSIKYKAKVK